MTTKNMRAMKRVVHKRRVRGAKAPDIEALLVKWQGIYKSAECRWWISQLAKED